VEKVVLINEITLKGLTRVGYVVDPVTGRRHMHGLGTVGEPIRPYEGERTEGYSIALPDDLREVSVRRVDFANVDRRGRYTYLPASWADLGASDVEDGTNGGAA